MLKIRVIPTLLWKGVGLVKGESFNSWRRVGSVLPAIKVYNARDVDELILLDIEAGLEGRGPDAASINGFSDECFVPFTVGGGVSAIDHFSLILNAGADKVCVNSFAYESPSLIEDAAKRFGSQCVVVSIDARFIEGQGYRCFSRSGQKNTNKDPVLWAKEMEDRGAGELFVTSIERDGTMKGYDLDLIGSISSAVRIPVVASGGAGCYQDMVDAVVKAGASAVAAASIFHFTELTPSGAKKALYDAGIPVRT